MKPCRVLLCFCVLLIAWRGDAQELTGAREEIAALRQEIARHDDLYHRKAAPEISDYEYDQLKRRLADMEKAFPEEARGDAAVAEIGDDRSGLFPTQRHRERMLSLDKAYELAELAAFHERLAKRFAREELEYVVEPKFDGIAVSVTYQAGRLVSAVTRGNGVEGDEITTAVRSIAGFREMLEPHGPVPELVEIRGEIFVPFREFERVNAEREAAGEAPFANPRNLAAGTIRQRDTRTIARRGLRVVFFGFGAYEPAAARPATQREGQERLKAWGLPAVEKMWFALGGADLARAVDALREARRDFAFPTDGAVVKLDSIALQREAGVGESAPRWALAFKFAPEQAETRVRAITIQVGRSGVLTPVAELEPVELAGSTIARATLHNRDELARKDIRIGDIVVIEKAGEIIPAIVRVERARRPVGAEAFAFPTACPGCGSDVVERAGAVAMFCGNRRCPEQVCRRVEHFASRSCLNIAGLGPATIAALVKNGAVKEVSDLYRLRREDLLRLPKIGRKSAERLMAAIEASKRAELWRVVHGLGIPQVGAVTAREIARRCDSLDDLLNDEALREHFADERNRAVVAELIAAGVRPRQAAAGGALAGKTFVLTGEFSTTTHARAREMIEAAGGSVRERVGATTDYLVAGEDAGAKLDEATRRGVRVIDEAELLRLVGER